MRVRPSFDASGQAPASERHPQYGAIRLDTGFVHEAAGRAALVTEFTLRSVTSGFYGALTERFRLVEPRWAATLTASVLLPVVSHTVELMVHWFRHTEALAASIAASACLTIVSTAFNLHIMRQGVLIVGTGSQPLRQDLRALPRLVATFVGLKPATPNAAPQST